MGNLMKKYGFATSAFAIGVALVATAFIGLRAQAAIYDGLSDDEKNQVQAGSQVVKTVDVAGASWPKVTVYQYVKATPEEVMGVFTDYERATSYMGGLTKAKISKRIDARTVEIDYLLALPLVADEWYTVRDTLSDYDNGHAYQVAWSLVKAYSTRSSEGAMKVEAMGSGSIISYYNFVVSNRAGAGFLYKKAIARVKDSVRDIQREVERVKDKDPAYLSTRVKALSEALGH